MIILVGTDIESVHRFHNLSQKKNILKKIFFDSEFMYAFNKSNSAQSLAGIWCAKEAVVKSFSQIKLLSIKDVEIICIKNKAPKALINFTPDDAFKYTISISISHTKEFATAIAVLTLFNDGAKLPSPSLF